MNSREEGEKLQEKNKPTMPWYLQPLNPKVNLPCDIDRMKKCSKKPI